MIVVAHNLAAMNAQRQFGIVNTKRAKTAEKLSSGYRVNRAADDAAGLAISEKMRRQIRGLNQAAENIQEGIGYVQTADGALNEAHDILQRMNELAVKAANGTNTREDREYVDMEIQQLKEELDRIFETTTFNERRIWEVTGVPKILGYEQKQAVTSTTSGQSIQITNDNYDVLAHGAYAIGANDQGLSISWTGYNGQTYQTLPVDWDTLKANNYSFNMGDYFDEQTYPELFDANGGPVFTRTISFNVLKEATTDDMIASLNGVNMWDSSGASMSGRFEAADGASRPADFSVISSQINYGAAYASREGGSGTANLTAMPTATTVEEARNSTDGWTFSFDLDGVGTVTAKSVSIDYASNDRAEDDENTWWAWGTYTSNGVEHKYVYTLERTISGGSLGNVMDALTGDKGTGTPGLLTADNGGAADNGGYIDIDFTMTADNAYNYGTASSSDVGRFTLRIAVDASDTEQSILDKINRSLNAATVLDFYSASGTSDSGWIGSFSARTHKIDVPIIGGACEFYVQAGAEANQHIDIVYDSLSVLELGLGDTNVLTAAACDRAIEDIKSALHEINAQRADFGAYQNRLEHAYNNNKNVEENTQASEALIRDADMAELMVRYSNQNILMEAGQAMLAQANQSNQGILSVLN